MKRGLVVVGGTHLLALLQVADLGYVLLLVNELEVSPADLGLHVGDGQVHLLRRLV